MNFYHELAKLMLNRRSDDIPDDELIISGKFKELPEYHWCKKCVWATNLGDRYMCPFVEGSCVRLPDAAKLWISTSLPRSSDTTTIMRKQKLLIRRKPMKTNIIKTKGDWQDVVNACRATVSKPPLGHEPSTEFKTMILISEHSPIRLISFLWDWKQIKSWVATHWSRHKFEKFIETQRTDRTGIDRDDVGQGALVDFEGDANIQNLIDAFRKRLCYTASPETRKLGEDFKSTLRTIQPEISDVLVPNCIYRCGCPEPDGCGYFNSFRNWCMDEYGVDEKEFMTIKERYDLYNECFYEREKNA